MTKLGHDLCNFEHLVPLLGCYLNEAERQLDRWTDTLILLKCLQRVTELNDKNAGLKFVFLLTWVVRLVIVHNKHILSRVGYLSTDINH
jgi:hypothetical protein